MSKRISELKPRKQRLKGFPGLFYSRIQGIEEYPNFKNYSKDISIKLLLNPLDGKLAALVTIDKGTISVKGIPNDNPEKLRKKVLGWNGRMSTDLRTFLQYAAGELDIPAILKKILTGKIKVRATLYFLILQKIFSLKAEMQESHEPDPPVETNIKTNYAFSRLLFYIGFIHLSILILSLDNIDLLLHALIFGFFTFWLGSTLSKLAKINLIDDRPILITATTLTILNIIMYSTLILIGMAGEKYYLNYLMLFAIGFDIICFVRFYSVKVNLDQMDLIEKLDYFSIVVIRGLGIGLLFNIINWIIPPDINIIMIIYILIFGCLNTVYGNKLLSKKKEVKIQLGALFVLSFGLIFAILIYIFIIPDPKCLVNLILFSMIIPIRVVYIKKNFKK